MVKAYRVVGRRAVLMHTMVKGQVRARLTLR